MSKPSKVESGSSLKSTAAVATAPVPEALPPEYLEAIALHEGELACPQCGGKGWCDSGCPTL